MFVIIALLFIVVETKALDYGGAIFKPEPTNFTDWDYIVYSQRWPITTCIDWQERSTSNSCNLPKSKDRWSVHGIWPTKKGFMGPFFCDSAIKFDPDLLQPFMDDLNEHWTNVEGGTKKYSFWKHEWDKHGTCASVSPLLNSVPNYFHQGLKWNSQYDLATLLAKANILPNNQGYTIEDIYNAVKTATGKNPVVQCNVEGTDKESMISEIRLCFDKDFALIDCTEDDGIILSNCSGKKRVMYLSSVPPKPTTTTTESYYEDDTYNDITEGIKENYSYGIKLAKFYNTLRFITWLTT